MNPEIHPMIKTIRKPSCSTVLPVVRKIVKRKTLLALSSDASDVIQSVALRLWKWRRELRG